MGAAVSLGKGNPPGGTQEWLTTSIPRLRLYHRHQPQHPSAHSSGTTYTSFSQMTPPPADSAPNLLSALRGLMAGQCSPPHPPTCTPSHAGLSLSSCSLCQEREAPSCSPQAKGKRGLEGAWPWDGSGTTPCRSPATEATFSHGTKCHETWLHVLLLQLTQNMVLGELFCRFLRSVSLPPCLL